MNVAIPPRVPVLPTSSTAAGLLRGGVLPKIGAAAVAVGVIGGIALWARNRPEHYFVHLAHQADFSSAHDPASVNEAIRRNWAEHGVPLQHHLDAMQGVGLLRSFEGFPSAGGFLVTVAHHDAQAMRDELAHDPEAGLVERAEG